MPEKTYAERLKPSGNSYGSAFSAAKKAGKKNIQKKFEIFDFFQRTF